MLKSSFSTSRRLITLKKGSGQLISGTSIATHRCVSRAPLFDFTEDEVMMRNLVQDFCKQSLPWELVSKMDKESKLDPVLLNNLFEVGLMGIEIPEEYGGSGASFTSSIIAIEELAKVDPAISVIV